MMEAAISILTPLAVTGRVRAATRVTGEKAAPYLVVQAMDCPQGEFTRQAWGRTWGLGTDLGLEQDLGPGGGLGGWERNWGLGEDLGAGEVIFHEVPYVFPEQFCS